MPTCLLGVDNGGKGPRCRRMLVQKTGRPRRPIEIELLGETSLKPGIASLNELLDHIAASMTSDISGIVVACAAILKNHRSVIQAPNAHFLDGVQLAKIIEKRFGVKCVLLNDMECAGPGMWYMAGCPRGIVITITWSSGIGVRFLIDGKIISCATELGHMVINASPLGRVCGCGGHNHVEGATGGVSLTNHVRELLPWRQYVDQTEQQDQVHPLRFLDQAFESHKAPWADYIYRDIAKVMGTFLYNMLMFAPDVKEVLWKGTVAQHALTIRNGLVARNIRQTMREHQMYGMSVDRVPFKLVPGSQIVVPGEPDDDSFYGAGLAAFEYGLAA